MNNVDGQGRRGYKFASVIYDPVIERGMTPVRRKTLEISGAAPGVAALDLCCGTGRLAQLISRAGADTTGVELSDFMFSRARKKEEPNLKFIQADAAATGLPDSSFDLAFTGFSLHEVSRETSAAFLKEMRRLVKPGGSLIFTDFSAQTPRNFKHRARKAFAGSLEFIAGGEHFRCYADWMKAGGLAGFLAANNLPPEKTIPLNGGHILIAKSRNTK